MALSRGALAGLVLGGLGALAGLSVPLVMHWRAREAASPSAAAFPLEASVDTAGPYVVLATARASGAYAEAIAEGMRLHPGATRAPLDPNDPASAGRVLKGAGARHALLYLLPGELDVNLAWAWLATTARLDDDPFVDVRTGFVTASRG